MKARAPKTFCALVCGGLVLYASAVTKKEGKIEKKINKGVQNKRMWPDLCEKDNGQGNAVEGSSVHCTVCT